MENAKVVAQVKLTDLEVESLRRMNFDVAAAQAKLEMYLRHILSVRGHNAQEDWQLTPDFNHLLKIEKPKEEAAEGKPEAAKSKKSN